MVQRDLYMGQIIPLIDNELIKVITGIRRCGKSCILKSIIKELVDNGKEDRIIYLTLDKRG
jgi:predicted AAA+ superfamily ATPase